MAIARKPKSNQTDISSEERAAEEFIAGAKTPARREKKTPILVRFDPHILERVDQAAGRRGISRSAWIHFMVSLVLEQEEG